MSAYDSPLPPGWRKQGRVIVPQGQRFVLPRDPITGLLNVNVKETLLRGEDRGVESWQVNLAPIFRLGIGPMTQGMPGFAFPPLPGGSPRVEMTWGGGGISFRHDFQYPVAGSSFAVSADNINIVVSAGDNVTVFAVENTPVVSGWLKPIGRPTSPQPLLDGFETTNPIYGPRVLFPWCRAIVIGNDTPGATITAVLTSEFGPVATFVWVATGYGATTRIPVGNQTSLVTVTPSAGNVMVAQELVFT